MRKQSIATIVIAAMLGGRPLVGCGNVLVNDDYHVDVIADSESRLV